MSKTIFVTGGYKSGKSRWAVSYLEKCDNVLYLVTSALPDPDSLHRLEVSNEMNFVKWDVEIGVDGTLTEYVKDHKFVVLDSLAGYTLNRVRILTGGKVDISDDERHEITKQISGEVQDLYDLLAVNGADGIVLSIETGFSIDPGDPMMKLCKQILGAVNQRVANMSSDVYLSVSGIQFKIK